MSERSARWVGRLGAAGVAAAWLVLATAAGAGTGRLLSPWVNRAPRIDGQLTPGEWNAATILDLGSGVTVLIENDGRTLYLAAVDAGDTSTSSGDLFFLMFDDEGGPTPILDDGDFASPLCQNTPNLGEGGLILRSDQIVEFDERLHLSGCTGQDVTERLRYRTAAHPEGVTYEAALPLDGPMPLQAGPGERFGLMMRLFRDGNLVACYPDCLALDPATFRNLVLASGGCNTGPQEFGSGDPLVGLPLDWTSENTAGGGPGWVQAPPAQFGDPVFCQANDTGGAGGAACISNFFCTAPRTDSLLRMPLALEGETAATVRVRADISFAAPAEYLDIGIRRLDTSGNSLLFWLEENHNQTVELWIPVAGSPPVELWFTHSTFSAGGSEGGFAQIDDVELICGPRIFSDGFESGLATHWSADQR